MLTDSSWLKLIINIVENIVNYRPLTYVSEEVEHPRSLTPNHFLLGGANQISAERIFQDTESLRRNWRI